MGDLVRVTEMLRVRLVVALRVLAALWVPEEQLLGLLLWLPVEDTELLTEEEGAAEGLAITSFRMLLEGLLKAV